MKILLLLPLAVFSSCYLRRSNAFISPRSTGGVLIQSSRSRHESTRRETDSHTYLNTLSKDNSFDVYSNCLTPRQERDQISDELALSREKWPKKTMKKIGRVISRSAKRQKKPGNLILIRSGESEFAANFTFAGWADPTLTNEGILQMEHAGRLLLESGFEPDIVYTSRLKRSVISAWSIVQEISSPFLPMRKSWRLNERHYGSLQGLCKIEAASKFGTDVVQAWRRSLKARPPPAEKNDNINNSGNDRKYNDLLPEQIPQSESLEDCLMRTEPLWQFIKRDLMKGENVMVVAHANSLRGLAKIIDNIGDEEIQDVSFPKGIPLIYRFGSNMEIVKPSETDLTPIHTSGIFLEKPKLLEVAIAKVKKEDSILGSDVSGRLPGVAKRMSTVEESLLQLRKEKEEWSKSSESVSEDESSLEDEEEKNDERFETKSASANKEGIQVTFNTNAVNNPKDPVVVLIRHGRTPHNKLSLFTGWEDPPLAEEGVEDAEWAGRLLKKHGFEFDVVYTSWLYRAIQTAWYVLYEMDQLWVPLMKSWRLNERHYGDLTGKSKKMIGNIYGEDQLKKWRKGYKQRPPQVSSYSFNYPGNDKRRIKYVKDIRVSFTETICRSIEDRKFSLHRKFPKGESLKDTMDRSIPFYTERIVPEAIAKGKRVLITSHENAIRGILMHLCEIPEECMTDLNLPNGVPLVYNVRRKCISLLDDGTGDDPLEKYNFGSAAQYLFRPCEIDEDEDWYVGSLNE